MTHRGLPVAPTRATRLLRPFHRLRGLSTTAAGKELLHTSRIPTLHFQDSLPKLPVPALNETMKKLLYSAEPLVSKVSKMSKDKPRQMLVFSGGMSGHFCTRLSNA